MTEKSTEPRSGGPSRPMAEILAAVQSAGLGDLRWLGAAWAERIAAMNAEVAQFVAGRVREDVKTQHALLHCKSLQEAQEIQAAFVARAFEQYTAETGKLMQMQADLLSVGKASDNGMASEPDTAPVETDAETPREPGRS